MAVSRFQDHLRTGDHASRPAATAVDVGTLYSCTDHGKLYQSDGATWSDYFDGSSATPSGAAGGDLTGTYPNPTFSTSVVTAAAKTVLDDASVSAMVDTLGGAAATGTGALVRKDSPALTGNPTAPTQTAGNNSTRLATTAYVDSAVAAGTVAALDAIGDVDTTGVSDGDVLTYDSGSGNWIAAAPTGGGSVPDLIVLQDQKTQNTQSGTFTSGAWRTRTLNTEVTDAGGHCSLASNEFTLAAGTYRYHILAPAFDVFRHQARLYNVTDAAVVQYGTSEYAHQAGFVQTSSTIEGQVTIASSKAFRVEHQCQSTKNNQGFGCEANFATEVYCTVWLEKVA